MEGEDQLALLISGLHALRLVAVSFFSLRVAFRNVDLWCDCQIFSG